MFFGCCCPSTKSSIVLLRNALLGFLVKRAKPCRCLGLTAGLTIMLAVFTGTSRNLKPSALAALKQSRTVWQLQEFDA